MQGSDDQWYNCDSIAYAAIGKVQRLQEADWSNLRKGIISLPRCKQMRIVMASLSIEPPNHVFLRTRSTRSYTWMPGADIHIHQNRVRTIATRLEVRLSED